MKKFEKNMIITSVIALVLCLIFIVITGVVAVNSSVKFLKSEGVKNISELIDYSGKKFKELDNNGKIVVNENGDDQVTVDFSDGIHINNGKDVVDIDKTGIHVKSN